MPLGPATLFGRDICCRRSGESDAPATNLFFRSLKSWGRRPISDHDCAYDDVPSIWVGHDEAERLAVERKAAMIQALEMSKAAAGVAQGGHSVAGPHNRASHYETIPSHPRTRPDEPRRDFLPEPFQNKQGPPGREAVNLAVGFASTHSVNTVESPVKCLPRPVC
jgi:hypothetical protein